MHVPSAPGPFLTEFLPALAARASLAGVTSVGSITVVVGEESWNLRLAAGKLEVAHVHEEDAFARIAIPPDDFAPLISEPIAARGSTLPSTVPAGAFKLFAQDPRIASAMRHLPGSVLLEVRDGENRRRILITPGLRAADFDSAECVISCDMEDYLDAATGRTPPMQLFMSGKLTLTGNVQLAMALSGLFA